MARFSSIIVLGLTLILPLILGTSVAAPSHGLTGKDFHGRSSSTKRVTQESYDQILVVNSEKNWSGTFTKLFEPSGVTQLPNGQLLVVEDEPVQPLQLLEVSLSEKGVHLGSSVNLKSSDGLLKRLMLGLLDDIEGVTHDTNGFVYVIGSHNDPASKIQSNRQKFLRFSLSTGAMSEVKLKQEFKQELLEAYPEIAKAIRKNKTTRKAGLNIEGLTYDTRRNTLLVGLRTPLVKSHTVIVELRQPAPYFESEAKPDFAPDLWTLNLKEGGIRGLSYDKKSDQILTVSQREQGSGGQSKLWKLSASKSNKPIQISTKNKKLFNNVEGITPITLPGGKEDAVLFVRDDGNKNKNRGGSWFLLSREQLGIGSHGL